MWPERYKDQALGSFAFYLGNVQGGTLKRISPVDSIKDNESDWHVDIYIRDLFRKLIK